VAPEPVAPEPVAPEPVAPEPVAPEPVAPEPVAAPVETAVELVPLDFSVAEVAEPDEEVEDTTDRSVDPFASPEPVTEDSPPLDEFNFPEADKPDDTIPEAVDSFSFDTHQEDEASAEPEPEAQTDFDLPPLGDFNLPVEPLEPDAASDDGVIDLKEEDIAEEGAYGAVPERVEKRIAFLSDEQLTEIVERVAGAVIERLAAPMLEQVVWEVVPDLAESMVREEMAKIKPDAG
ncbi:MAG: hypothetical protein U9R29_04980, partial [Thermodesulfobacteriota bacterium]|nr:hypothetical protein [Thermodesulfobacteriota bacterium]